MMEHASKKTECPTPPPVPDFTQGRPADLWEASRMMNARMWFNWITGRRKQLPEPTISIHKNMVRHYMGQHGEAA